MKKHQKNYSTEIFNTEEFIMSDVFLNIEHISKTFSGVQALKDIDFELRSGEVHCLVGENGCGKSTLMKIIAGVHKPDRDPRTRISINSTEYTHYSTADSIREGIQVIYQDLSLFHNLSIEENISINSRIESGKQLINWEDVRAQAKKTMDLIHLFIDSSAIVSELSVAQQQMVAICRALTSNVKLLIMDEPTASLGKKDVEQLINIISILKAKGISILFIGHKLDEVFSIADRISVIRDGVLVKTIENVKEVSSAELVRLMTGTELAETRCGLKRSSDTPVLEVEKLYKTDEFSDISFKLYPGEILGVIGLVGSGRTELFSSIFGINNYESGTIRIDGRETSINSVKDAIDHGIGFVPEDRLTQGLFMSKPIEKNIIITTIKKYLNRLGLTDSTRIGKESDRWISELRIKTPSGALPASSLSGGNQQRIVLAKWIATNPRILILDGPTIGIDIGAKAEIHRLIENLVKETGMSVIMISDEIPEIVQNSTRILVMQEGRITWEADAADVTEDKIKEKLVEKATA